MSKKLSNLSISHAVALNDLHLAIGLLICLGKNIAVVNSLPSGYAQALSKAFSELESALSYLDGYR